MSRGTGSSGEACLGPCESPRGLQRGRWVQQAPRTVTKTSAGPEGEAQNWAPVLSSEAPDRVKKYPRPQSPQPEVSGERGEGRRHSVEVKALWRQTDPSTRPDALAV